MHAKTTKARAGKPTSETMVRVSFWATGLPAERKVVMVLFPAVLRPNALRLRVQPEGAAGARGHLIVLLVYISIMCLDCQLWREV